MSVSALKTAATGGITRNGKPQTLADLITGDSMKKQFALALPKHLNADRFTRVALTELRKVPKLMEADPASFMGAVMQCAQLGIEPGGALGHAYLLPFENRRSGKTEVQFILGYKGMIDLARRSGQIVSIEARAVYERDTFSVRFGLDPDLQHEPAWEEDDRGELRAVYAVAKLQGGGVQRRHCPGDGPGGALRPVQHGRGDGGQGGLHRPGRHHPRLSLPLWLEGRGDFRDRPGL